MEIPPRSLNSEIVLPVNGGKDFAKSYWQICWLVKTNAIVLLMHQN